MRDCGAFNRPQASATLVGMKTTALYRRVALLVLLLSTFGCLRKLHADERVTQTDVFTSGQDGYAVYRIPSLVVAPDDSLLAFAEARKNGKSDTGDIDLVVKRSTDGGKTWGKQRVVWDDGENTCGNPCVVVENREPRIFLLMTHNLGGDDEKAIKDRTAKGTRTVWATSSDDNGRTWEKPREITADVKRDDWTWYATGPGCGIQLSQSSDAGRLVVPCDHNTADGKRYSHVIVSDDNGRTWQLGGVTPEDEVNECEVVELADGGVMLNMRSYERSTPARQVAVSHNGGDGWQDQRHDPALIEPICQASIRRIEFPGDNGEPGLIVFSNPATTNKRQRMTLRGSIDDGQTWPAELVLHEGSSAYSCLARMPGVTPGDIGCLYEADDYGRIVFARVPQTALLGPAE